MEKNIMKKTNLIIIWLIIGVVVVLGLLNLGRTPDELKKEQVITDNLEPTIDFYTCGMHPSVQISPEEYKKGNVNCPICNMGLTPIYKEEAKTEKAVYGCGVDKDGKCPHCDLSKSDEKCICGGHVFTSEAKRVDCPICGKPLKKLTREEVDKLKGVVNRVKIKRGEIQLAGVKSNYVRRRQLYKEIRIVGKVAYDPNLAIAEEEFISTLKSMDKMKEGSILEIKERAMSLLESSKRKLRLLGLNRDQIAELENTRKVHTRLILPESKMWIYGDAYEHELPWIIEGAKVKVTLISLPGEEFHGHISSINPVIEPMTRTLRFRALVDNPNLKLKPQMYVNVLVSSHYVNANEERDVLAIPKNALLDTGSRKIVWVETSSGQFEGRMVEVGPLASVSGEEGQFYPVISGLEEGDSVVTNGNFLIDSQSQITGSAATSYGGSLSPSENKDSMKGSHSTR